MSFTWPTALLSILVVPLLLAAYLWNMRRRRKSAVRYSSVALLRSVVPARSRRRRHIPMALLLAGLAVLTVGAGRPQLTREVPVGRTSIILALDVSLSMCATDVDPNRLSAAQAAARSFVTAQPKGTRLGIVVFSGAAQVSVQPTTDHKALTSAIDALTTARGTAIGAAILKSLDAISEMNPEVAPIGAPPAAEVGPAGAKGFVPDIVVLLTDGANTRGVQPLDAVPYAVERKVRVYTIGFGTARATGLACSRTQLGADGLNPQGGFGGPGGPGGGGFPGGGGAPGGFPGGRSPLVADEPTLQQVAKLTGGAYYKAEDASQLRKVFADLPRDVVPQKERHEITTWFVAMGALLAAAAVVLSIRWSPYP